MSKYKLSNPEQKQYIVQHLSDDHDYSEYATREEAATADWDDSIADALIEGKRQELERDLTEEEIEEAKDEAKENHLGTYEVYTPEEVLKAVNEDDYGWPKDLGFVEEIEE